MSKKAKKRRYGKYKPSLGFSVRARKKDWISYGKKQWKREIF